ncbi:hypothetical protein R1sor_015504 [Riccia sorocarpa]|uniref:Uncharacterized protein n=1 Tax=Riccia sorocarpa TaxID=122646 RepID=A0ABD3HGB8_9MARC
MTWFQVRTPHNSHDSTVTTWNQVVYTRGDAFVCVDKADKAALTEYTGANHPSTDLSIEAASPEAEDPPTTTVLDQPEPSTPAATTTTDAADSNVAAQAMSPQPASDKLQLDQPRAPEPPPATASPEAVPISPVQAGTGRLRAQARKNNRSMVTPAT